MPGGAFLIHSGCRPRNTCLFLSCLLELGDKLESDQNSNRLQVDFRDTHQLPSFNNKLAEWAWDTSRRCIFWTENTIPEETFLLLFFLRTRLSSGRKCDGTKRGPSISWKKGVGGVEKLLLCCARWITMCWCLFSSTSQTTRSHN